MAKLPKKRKTPPKPKKTAYCEAAGGNESDGALSEGEVADQEAEALALQKEQLDALAEEDFGIDDALAEAGGKEELLGSGDAADMPPSAAFSRELELMLGSFQGIPLTSEQKKLNEQKRLRNLPLSKQRKATAKSHPELLALLTEMLSKLKEAQRTLVPLMPYVDSGHPLEFADGQAVTATKAKGRDQKDISAGLTFLEAKNQVLLTYLTYLSYYIVLKTEGVQVNVHPVIDRLVELRLLIDKMVPIEERLRYKIDRILKLSSSSGEMRDATSTEPSHAERFRPRLEMLSFVDNSNDGSLRSVPELLDQSATAETEDAKSADECLPDSPPTGSGEGIYRPPKLNPVEYNPINRKMSAAERAERELTYQRRKLERSELVKQLRSEVADTPREIGATGVEETDVAMDEATGKLLERERALEEYEEEHMRRFQQNSKDRKALKLLRKQQATLAGGATVADVVRFADAALASVTEDADHGPPSAITTYLRAAQNAERINASSEHAKPSKSKRKFESDSDNECDEEIIDDLAEKRLKRRRKDGVVGKIPSVAHEKVSGDRRKVNKKIVNNRGIGSGNPNSKKASNPRVVRRQQYERKLGVLKRRRGGSKESTGSGVYHGESSGLPNPKLVRSRKL